MHSDELYMRRALQLAGYAEGFARPNPMVGAVIVAEGKIIGQGWTQPFGGPHAEVMAVRSVSRENRPLIEGSTVYVTLEPCAHWGKTPPCAAMLVEQKVGRVVVGTKDPFEKVSGKGISILRQAGISVETGCLEAECKQLNRRFMTAHRLGRPHIELKWAQTADFVIGLHDKKGNPVRLRISSPLSRIAMHRDRSMADAVVIGSGTALADRPKLTVRDVASRENPRRIVLDRRGRLVKDAEELSGFEVVSDCDSLEGLMQKLYAEGVTSVVVEGGTELMKSFLREGLYDEIRVETSSDTVVNDSDLIPVLAPCLPENVVEISCRKFPKSVVKRYRNKDAFI